MSAPYSFLPSESKANLHDPAEGKSLVGHPEDDFDYAEPLSTRPRILPRAVTWALYALCIVTMLLAVTNLGITISRATTGRRIPIEKLPTPDIEIGLQK
jgi:hypothetical protein